MVRKNEEQTGGWIMKKWLVLVVVLALAARSNAKCWDPHACAGQPYGDATCDGVVGLGDLFALKAYYGKMQPYDAPECCSDFNHDGAVSLGDLFILKTRFGTSGYSPSTGSQRCDWRPDIDKNLHVDLLDYARLAADWPDCNHSSHLPGDVTGDGCVDAEDLKIIADSWLNCYVGSARSPGPMDDVPNVPWRCELGWSPGDGALYHDVYFGTDANAVADAGHGSPEFADTVADPCFDPCVMEPNTRYHWRVDEVGPACVAKGDVWSFTTGGEPNAHLVSHWKFDEGTGPIAYDSAGDNDGGLQGDPNWVSGYIGSHALEFDGADDYIAVSADSNLNVQYVTMSAWVRVHETDPGTHNFILNRQMTDPGTYTLWVRASDNKWGAQVRLQGSESTGRIIVSNNAVTGEWTHVCATYDGDKLKLYIESVRQDDVDDTNGTIDTDNPGVLTIGAHPTPASYFNGSIDDARIYNRALIAEEVQQLYGP
jgi:hypothetical protein